MVISASTSSGDKTWDGVSVTDELIVRLDKWLRAHRPDYYRWLLPGLTDFEYKKFEKRLGRQLPAAFRALYQWRNGQSDNCYKGFQDNRQFASAESILHHKQVIDEVSQAGDFTMANWWHSTWVPFLDNGGGDAVCLDLTGVFTGCPGQLIKFWHDWEDRSVQYPSLLVWLDVFVGSLEMGLWADVGGDLHPVDEEAWARYRRRHSPGYPLRYEAGG